ncbi:MAG: sigma-54 dependent transcriptional regulator [Candidatus Sumerlaeia bacterium]
MANSTARILIVEDDRTYAERLARNLEREGFSVEQAIGGAAALSALAESSYDLVLTDIKMPEMDGLELIRRIRQGGVPESDPDVPVVALTSVNAIDTAVEAVRAGAADYITKDSEFKEVVLRIQKVLDGSRLAHENRWLRERLERMDEFAAIVGDSPAIKRIKQEIMELAGSAVSVLLLGETGVGKELVARAIHRLGPRRDKPFVDINCGALPTDNLFQSEVFGHERGAFTDAKELKRGRFELAQNGTLFLDEIAELSLESQSKILRVIETGEFQRLGGTRTLRVETRYIFATNRDLGRLVREGRFRQDLYYRINVYPLEIPPLRRRRQDIPLLAAHFLGEFCRRYRREPKRLSARALNALVNYDWEGNVRELKNIMERLVIRTRGVEITEEHLRLVGFGLAEATPSPAGSIFFGPDDLPDEGIQLEEWEKQLVLAALQKARWNQKKAAELLGISVDRMNHRVKKFGITHESWRVHK